MGMNRDAMARLQQMQAQLAKTQADLQEKRVQATAGGGAVSVTVTGGLKVEALTINPDVIDPDDAEMLQDLITAALNEALQQINGLQMQTLIGLAGSLGLGL